MTMKINKNYSKVISNAKGQKNWSKYILELNKENAIRVAIQI